MDGTPLHPPVIDREAYGADESQCNTVERNPSSAIGCYAILRCCLDALQASVR
jgi:hypothetical protein